MAHLRRESNYWINETCFTHALGIDENFASLYTFDDNGKVMMVNWGVDNLVNAGLEVVDNFNVERDHILAAYGNSRNSIKHFATYHTDGKGSHKPGAKTLSDINSEIIQDLKLANMGLHYGVFQAYMRLNPNKVLRAILK